MRWTITLFALCALAGRGWAEDGDLADRVKRLEKRLDDSEERNRKLEEEIAARDRGAIEKSVETYLAGTAEDVDGARTQADAFLTFYGFVRLDIYSNTARMDSVIAPTVVLVETPATEDDDQFSMAIRQSRIGMILNFGEIAGRQATGVIEMDFAASAGGALSLLRLRLAYAQIDVDGGWLRFGQDWDVISPLNPNINDESLMLFTGNIGERRPMVRWHSRPDNSPVSIDIALGVSGTFGMLDLDGGGPGSELDGFDSGLPHLQVRAAWHVFDGGSGETIIGFWGYIAAFETDTVFGGETTFNPWVLGIDWTVRLGGGLTLLGELWVGEALGDMGGNVGQSINTVTGVEIRGVGAWFEIDWRPNDEWQLYLGGSIDDPDGARLAAGGVSQNWAAYFGARRHFSKTFRVVVGILYWQTTYASTGQGDAVRINVWTSIDF